MTASANLQLIIYIYQSLKFVDPQLIDRMTEDRVMHAPVWAFRPLEPLAFQSPLYIIVLLLYYHGHLTFSCRSYFTSTDQLTHMIRW